MNSFTAGQVFSNCLRIKRVDFLEFSGRIKVSIKKEAEWKLDWK